MLDQLVSEDYVQRLPKRRGYMLGERVLDLSAGFSNQDAVVEVARPFLSSFTQKFKWPLVLATLDIDAMRIRASTGPESPFSAIGDRAYLLHRRIPLLPTAIGRAYLAFCPDDERQTVLSLLRSSSRVLDRPARNVRSLNELLGSVAKAGYAGTDIVPGDPATGLAVPIRFGERVLGTLALRYLRNAISEKEVMRRYLCPLQTTASSIADAYAKKERRASTTGL